MVLVYHIRVEFIGGEAPRCIPRDAFAVMCAAAFSEMLHSAILQRNIEEISILRMCEFYRNHIRFANTGVSKSMDAHPRIAELNHRDFPRGVS